MGYLSCAYKDVQNEAQQKLMIMISRQKDIGVFFLYFYESFENEDVLLKSK